ncbi:hypothetical protein [Chitinimonas sp. BJB300]|nr:hypothetical protein [Chitinimonas sp. BJB300]
MTSNWQVENDSNLYSFDSTDKRMVWAKDLDTDMPIHVGELTPDRRGAASRCICCFCKAPLKSINAARSCDERRIRPHFRHPENTEKDSCLVVSARQASIALWYEQGVIELPKRTALASMKGVSGYKYEGRANRNSERVRIQKVQSIDITRALLTLDDGRELLVYLVAEEVEPDEHGKRAIITLRIDDPKLASLAPEELRKHINILLSKAEWNKCWSDEIEEAKLSAITQADESYDWWHEDKELEFLPAEMRGETLLHRMAKSILARIKLIRVPELTYSAEMIDREGIVHNSTATRNAATLQLMDVQLEKKLGQIRPDLIGTTLPMNPWPVQTLLVEITVSNKITPERLARIREVDQACMEINLSQFSGRVTVADMEKLLSEDDAGKCWLYHPDLVDLETLATAQVLQKVAIHHQQLDKLAAYETRKIEEAEWKLKVSFMTETKVVRSWFKCWYEEQYADGGVSEEQRSWQQAMLIKDIPLDLSRTFNGRSLLLRLTEIVKLHKSGRQSLPKLGQLVMNICSDEIAESKCFHPLYLLALKKYPPMLTDRQQIQFNNFSNIVREGFRKREKGPYTWPVVYDRLLLILFPVLEPAIIYLRSEKNQTISKSVQATHTPIKSQSQNSYVGGNGGHDVAETSFAERKFLSLKKISRAKFKSNVDKFIEKYREDILIASGQFSGTGCLPWTFADRYAEDKTFSVDIVMQALKELGVARSNYTWS